MVMHPHFIDLSSDRDGFVLTLLLPLLLLFICRCDRILWRGKGMKQVRYERCGGYRLSDHRPVRAVFHAVCELVEGVDA